MANNTAKDVGHISKFDGSNFPSWKYGVWMLLEKNRLISVVDGSETLPEQRASQEFFFLLVHAKCLQGSIVIVMNLSREN
ncbi:Uncharacterized protein APZ42_004517 [Daphnia magna]|uniref:Retrotransposon Copia-like N-terminal domain-containing protein n=1 Tax=Daphnia magna TaxID=35525 RepID=A0A162CUZ4_9CRUS|nr:Uncharacterized protein APZ42_004517 [Daphnia magna]